MVLTSTNPAIQEAYNQLEKAGLEYTTANDGIHLRVQLDDGNMLDFWPTTGNWKTSDGHKDTGISSLLNYARMHEAFSEPQSSFHSAGGMVLRPYQDRAMSELYAWLERHSDGNPIVDACVGAGKSVIIAEFCRRAIAEYPQCRIVMCVASRELCQQNLEKLMQVWPEAPAGVCSASLGRKDTESQIVFATIGSIYNHADVLGRVDILLVDECHNINSKKAGMYRTFIDKIQQYGNPHLCVIGFTGTPFRGDGIWLHHGEDPLFHGIATQVGMSELLDLGYLSPLVVDAATPTMGDTSGVSIQAGDYVVSQLEEVMADDDLVRQTVADLMVRGANRKKWLVFCVTIKHARMVLNAIQYAGIEADMVTGETPSRDRAQIIRNFKHGNLRCLVNVACLTTGFDAPETDLIALLRPTKSPVLYVQIAGRGMRIADGKADCLWLDYTNTTSDLGPINKIKGRKKLKSKNSDGENAAPFKLCENCGNQNPIAALECIDCGAPFPEPESRNSHNTSASDALPLAGVQAPKLEWFEVRGITYSRHHGKEGKLDTLRVDYDCGFETISEWKCFDHEGYAQRMAKGWWAERWNGEELMTPNSVAEALQEVKHLLVPGKIAAHKEDRFWRLTQYDFSTTIEYQSPDFGSGWSDDDDDLPF